MCRVTGLSSLLAAIFLTASITGETALAAGNSSVTDRAAIEDLISAYTYATDATDAARFKALWADDAEFVLGGTPVSFKGRKQIEGYIDFVKAARKKRDSESGGTAAADSPVSNLLHMNQILDINIQGSTATAASYWLEIISKPHAQAEVWQMGRYADKFVKRDGRWLFQQRIVSCELGVCTGVPDLVEVMSQPSQGQPPSSK